MRYLSLFSGIEAATVAWKPIGWQAVAFSEIEPFPAAVTAFHNPGVPNLGDVTEADFDAIGDVELVVGGSPCQSFSLAGKRLGMDDPRGNLALEFARIVYRKRPAWFVFENVPGLLSSDSGYDFGTLLAALAGHPAGSVFEPPAGGWQSAGVVEQAEDGYGLAWRVLDAQYFGLAQRRRRVFVVGYLGDWRRAAAVLLERESLQGNPAPRREKGSRAAGSSSSGTGGGGGRRDEKSGKLVAFALRGRDEGAVPEIHGDGSTVGSLRSASGGSSRDYVAYGQSGHFGGFDENAPTLRANGGDVDPGSEVIVAYGGNNTSGPIDVHTCLSSSHTASGRQDFETETFLVFDPVQITSGQNRSNPTARRTMPHAAGGSAGTVHCRRLRGPANHSRGSGGPSRLSARLYGYHLPRQDCR